MPRALLFVLTVVAVAACAGRYTVKSALLSAAHLRPDECAAAEVIRTGDTDCDGLPIYELRCAGRDVISEAIQCHRGDCFVEQMAGRCWK